MLTFENGGDVDMTMHWVDFEGNEVDMGPLAAGQSTVSSKRN